MVHCGLPWVQTIPFSLYCVVHTEARIKREYFKVNIFLFLRGPILPGPGHSSVSTNDIFDINSC